MLIKKIELTFNFKLWNKIGVVGAGVANAPAPGESTYKFKN